VALVTGAAHGIGRAVMQRLQELGAAVVGLDKDPVVRELSGSNAVGLVCDLTDGAAVRAAIDSAVVTFGGIDVVVSNAGSFPEATPLAELDEERWSSVHDINLDAHFRVLRSAVPHLARGTHAAVVVVGSKNVAAPGPGVAAYSVAKAGLTQLARVAALELGEKGIRVNVVHPDAVFDTRLWSDAKLEARASAYNMSIAEYKARNILRREVGARDVAAVIARLLSREFDLTTGAQIPIDGGNVRVV
jgi:NAD(P)-dependent dehydrogenase (short-subunit alcohol dehydrogenase family)